MNIQEDIAAVRAAIVALSARIYKLEQAGAKAAAKAAKADTAQPAADAAPAEG